MDPAVLTWAQAQTAGSEARNLAAAYASGTLRVRFADGREVLYRSLAEIERALTGLYGVQAVTVTSRRPGYTLAGFRRGF